MMIIRFDIVNHNDLGFKPPNNRDDMGTAPTYGEND